MTNEPSNEPTGKNWIDEVVEKFTELNDTDADSEPDEPMVLRNFAGEPIGVVGDGVEDMLRPYLDGVAHISNVRRWAAGLSDGARIDVIGAVFDTAPAEWRGPALAYLTDKYPINPFARLARLGQQAREAGEAK